MKSKVEKSPQLLFENQICFPLYSAANAVVRAYRPLLESLDLTYLQYMVMMVLWQERELSVGDLGQRLRLDSGTLTPLLKRLEGKGYVTRSRGEKDQRVRVIAITRQGMALRARAGDIPVQLACTVGLPEVKGRALKTLCQEILDALENSQEVD